ELVTTCDRDVVAALGRAIAQRIGEPRYNLWFGSNTKFSWEDDLLRVGVPNYFFQEWLQNTFADAVQAAASEGLSRPMPVRFAIDPELFRAARQAQESDSKEQGIGSREQNPPTQVDAKGEGLSSVLNGPAASQKQGRSPVGARHTPKRTRHWRRLADFVVGP